MLPWWMTVHSVCVKVGMNPVLLVFVQIDFLPLFPSHLV